MRLQKKNNNTPFTCSTRAEGLMKLLIEIQINCSHISSGCEPALLVYDSRIQHQRHLFNQVLVRQVFYRLFWSL